MGLYQFDPDMPPDSAFEPGRLEHLVVGKEGRLLDARRTPVRVVGLRPELAFFEVEVLAFEDRFARWELPMDTVSRFQFAPGEPIADAATVAWFAAAVERFAAVVDIPVSDARRAETLSRLAEERTVARRWFEERSRWGRGDRTLGVDGRTGDPLLFGDLAAYVADLGLTSVEQAFARCYVSNPGAGEEVKGHAVVTAELALAAYCGPAVRDPASFEGHWSRERRRQHLLARLAFVSTMFTLAGRTTVDLYRGMSFENSVDWRPRGPFVSATFHRPIAEDLSALGPHRASGILVSQRVEVDRLLMTFLETEALNTPFAEAEAVVLASPITVF